ncbi:hypothetical protein KSD_69930 [Ktedonobacter sp. SOSP1-85]|uniref:DinB family protein n=1 Tax=Ktedonobacter sp. SOSP1-85 TaxID=2778367 RepID=UPI001914E0B1|nr:DinB family protein [Ktedonobacter sp. SOSP1-85]GHO79222.1 hypothetical protein KSD_69930 [Ktedonobacter sp. SOSP1-85]
MPHAELPVEKILSLLGEGPTRIAALTSDLSPAQLRTSPHGGAWSATDVLAHLRSCADVWGQCIHAILVEEQPTLRAVHPSAWVKGVDYPTLEFEPSLQAYTAQRAELLTLLESLSAVAWSRTATITGAGKPLVRTVKFYAEWLATHERSHYKQFKQLHRAFS